MSKETIYWTTKTGKQIDIDDMDIDHLRNTLKMLVRNREEEVEFDNYRDAVPSDFYNSDETYTDYLRYHKQ